MESGLAKVNGDGVSLPVGIPDDKGKRPESAQKDGPGPECAVP